MEATPSKNECAPVAPVKRDSSSTPPPFHERKYGKFQHEGSDCCTCGVENAESKCRACHRHERWQRVLQKLRWVSRGLGSHKEASFLFPEHWLEAVDERHRVGSGLNHYFSSWLRSTTDEVSGRATCFRAWNKGHISLFLGWGGQFRRMVCEQLSARAGVAEAVNNN
jgi:hypothetical protein